MRKWIVAGHVDQVRRKGDYFLYKVGQESIIVVRSDETNINAFYNVCRHRGSVICTESSGRVTRLTCPYHAWSYGLDGELLAARLMPADFAKEENGLHRCHVRVFHGLIFINLSEQEPVNFDATFADLSPYLEFHGLADARIAIRAPIPPMRIGSSWWRTSWNATTALRHIRNSSPCILQRPWSLSEPARVRDPLMR